MTKEKQYLDDYTKKSGVKEKIDWNDYHLEAKYEYKDKDGNVLWYKKKYRHKDGKNKTLVCGTYEGKKWKTGLPKDVEKPLYRLPELIASKDKVASILEGEKDVENLREWKFTGTCSPFGAKFWNEEYNKFFIGRVVCLIPDNDEAGQTFEQKVGESLIKVTKVHVARIPKKYKDFSEWKEAKGNNEEAFKKLKFEEWKEEKKQSERIYTTARQLVTEEVKELPAPVGKGLFVPERYTILAAPDGEGKTLFCSQLALNAVTGTTFLGFFPIPKPIKVLYFAGENSRGDMQTKLKRQQRELEGILGRSIKKELENFLWVAPLNINFFLNPKDKIELHAWLEDIRPDIVVFDPLADFIASNKSLNDDTLARTTAKTLTEIAQKYKCFPLITTHLRKEAINSNTGRSIVTPENVWTFVFGSRFWLASAAAQIVIIRANLQRYAKAKKFCFKFKTNEQIEPLQVIRNPNLYYEELPSNKIGLASLTTEDVKDILQRECNGQQVYSLLIEAMRKDLGCGVTIAKELIKAALKQNILYKDKKDNLIKISSNLQKELKIK